VAVTEPRRTLVLSIDELLLDGIEAGDPLVEPTILDAIRPALERHGLAASAPTVSAEVGSSLRAEAVK
jgi:hypothetical protein